MSDKIIPIIMIIFSVILLSILYNSFSECAEKDRKLVRGFIGLECITKDDLS